MSGRYNHKPAFHPRATTGRSLSAYAVPRGHPGCTPPRVDICKTCQLERSPGCSTFLRRHPSSCTRPHRTCRILLSSRLRPLGRRFLSRTSLSQLASYSPPPLHWTHSVRRLRRRTGRQSGSSSSPACLLGCSSRRSGSKCKRHSCAFRCTALRTLKRSTRASGPTGCSAEGSRGLAGSGRLARPALRTLPPW